MIEYWEDPWPKGGAASSCTEAALPWGLERQQTHRKERKTVYGIAVYSGKFRIRKIPLCI